MVESGSPFNAYLKLLQGGEAIKNNFLNIFVSLLPTLLLSTYRHLKLRSRGQVWNIQRPLGIRRVDIN